jgi:YD repeat-containing protein
MTKLSTLITRSALHTAIRELDHRHNDGIDVRLLWDPHDNRVLVSVTDERAGESISFDVDAPSALEAFNHPYAYAYADYGQRAGQRLSRRPAQIDGRNS